MNCAHSRPDNKNANVWLEAGGFALGPINLEAAMALPNLHLHNIQDLFLRLHDKKFKRLWFLWPAEETPAAHNTSIFGKCGCHGGCNFFGMNKNGQTFFRSRKNREASQVAIPQVCSADHDPGFGQSLLHEGKLVFELGQIGLRISPQKVSPTHFSFTRGYMSDLTSPDGTDVDAITTTACVSSVNSVCEGVANEGSSLPTPVKGSQNMTSLQEHVSTPGTFSRPLFSHSEILANQTSTPFSVASNSISSQTAALFEVHSPQDGNVRSGLGIIIPQTSAYSTFPSSSPPIFSDQLGSDGSGRSLEGVQTRFSSKSSLASPVSLRHAIGKVNSTVSLESDKYFSAEEEVVNNSENEGQNSYSDIIVSSQDSLEISMLTMMERDPEKNIDYLSDRNETPKPRNNTLKYEEKTPVRRKEVSQERKLVEKKGDRTLCTEGGELGSNNDDNLNILLNSSSSLSSVSSSTLSYTSAPSEQGSDSEEILEDLTLVHLRTQMNQPITQSPLLLNCYVRHLSQFHCQDWTCPGPGQHIYPLKKGLRSVQSEYSLSSASHSLYSACSSWMPHFQKVSGLFYLMLAF